MSEYISDHDAFIQRVRHRQNVENRRFQGSGSRFPLYRGGTGTTFAVPPTRGNTTGGSASGSRIETTWAAIDLAEYWDGTAKPIETALLERADGFHMLYEKKIHSINGESESLKSWLALLACKQTMDDLQLPVLYIDFEDDAAGITARLRNMGLKHRELFHYIRPDEPLMDEDELVSFIEDHNIVLTVLDGVTEAMTQNGLKLIDNSDIAKFLGMLPRTIQRAGSAVVMIDHVTKNADTRGRFAIGGQHKIAGVDVAFMVESMERGGIGRVGKSRILVSKDRNGTIRPKADGDCIGILVVDSTQQDKGKVHVSVGLPQKVLTLEERILIYVQSNPHASTRQVRENIGGNATKVGDALKDLESEGVIKRELGGWVQL